MPIFNTQVIRIAADTTSKSNILDLNTSAEPEAWWARNLTVQVSLFAGSTLLDVSDLQSVSLYLKDPSNLDGGALVTKTTTIFDNTTTLATWQSGAQQHFVISFTADDLSFSLTNGARLVHLSMVAVTTGGQTGTLCVGSVNIIDDGGNSPSSNPVNAITVTQAQAMVAALAFSQVNSALSSGATQLISWGQTWLLGRASFNLLAGSAPYVVNLNLSDTNALNGALLRIPIDFPGSANPTINIYDGNTGGTLLQGPLQNPSPGAPASFLFEGGFDGTNWHKENGVWVN